MAEVSIIIPNYNHAEYLRQRIESVLCQTYQDFEIIILDDCSTDNSRDIIGKYKNNEKISHVVYNDVNNGSPFSQWHKGIKLAKGNYVWIAESDDWCEPTLLETLMTGFEQDKNCVLSYCQSYCVFDDGRIKFQSNHIKLSEYVEGKKFIKNYIIPYNPIFNASMALWKKEVYLQISKDYISYKRIGDYLFWIEVVNCGNVFISGKLLNYFRAHQKNTSAHSLQSGMSFLDHIPLYKKLLERRLINKQDYDMALKKSYIQFRLAEKNMTAEAVVTIRKLFAGYAKPIARLKIYFYLKRLQIFSKRLLRV
ncbi:MAG TPA: glycosyltransferase family 2 protein [Parafilimonas sp.]|nr:glycosyltransferase family 2 protein [Parafilimonas sp.]